jgi:hypothetical protein
MKLEGIFKRVLIGFILMVSASVAQSTIIHVDLNFTDPSFPVSHPNWSGTLSYDDATGVPWLLSDKFTAFKIVSMLISDGSVSWDENDQYILPPEGGVILDSFGSLALRIEAVDNVGRLLRGSPNADVTEGKIGLSTLDTNYLGGDESVFYSATANAPEPITLALIGLGVAGIGYQRRNNPRLRR